MRALVRRAQHHEARAVARHQRVHHRAALVDAGAHDQPAHAVREQPDRLLGLLHQPVEELAEALGEHVERLAPVVRESARRGGCRPVLRTARRRTCANRSSASTPGLAPRDLARARRWRCRAGRTRRDPCRRRCRCEPITPGRTTTTGRSAARASRLAAALPAPAAYSMRVGQRAEQLRASRLWRRPASRAARRACRRW